MRYNVRVMTIPLPKASEMPRLDPVKERAAAERASREMRSAAVIITLSMAVAVVISVLILAWGHFGF